MPRERVDQYGVVGVGERKGKMFSITSMVEKPPVDRAPSNLILTGRYILQPEVLDLLAALKAQLGTGAPEPDALSAAPSAPASEDATPSS